MAAGKYYEKRYAIFRRRPYPILYPVSRNLLLACKWDWNYEIMIRKKSHL